MIAQIYRIRTEAKLLFSSFPFDWSRANSKRQIAEQESWNYFVFFLFCFFAYISKVNDLAKIFNVSVTSLITEAKNYAEI